MTDMTIDQVQKIIKEKGGFTLLELLIYIAILSIMTIIVANTFIMLTKGQGNIQAKSELNSNLGFAIEKIKRDITNADDIIMPFTAGGSSTSLRLDISGAIIRYAVTDGRLTRQIDTGTPEYITSDKVNISYLMFYRRENVNSILAKKALTIEIDLTGNYNSSSPDWQYSQSVKTAVSLNQDLGL